MNGREATFGIDKYKKPVLLDEKESLIQLIKNAFFMIPGNDPLHPTRGVNITQYLWKTEDQVDSTKIYDDLINCCNDTSVTDHVNSLTAGVTNIEGIPTLLVALRVTVADQEDQLAIAIQSKDNYVHFNYKYLSEMQKLVIN